MGRVWRVLDWLRPVPRWRYLELQAAHDRRLADWDDKADRYQKEINQAKLEFREAVKACDRAIAERNEARRELETARQDFEMRSRSHGEAATTRAQAENLTIEQAEAIVSAAKNILALYGR